MISMGLYYLRKPSARHSPITPVEREWRTQVRCLHVYSLKMFKCGEFTGSVATIMYMMEATLARVNRRVEYPPAATAPPLSLSPYPWGLNPAQLDANSSDSTKLALSPF
jgi:hypothetical protein